jgi:hypothetical protein
MIMAVLAFGYFYSGADFILCTAAPCGGTPNADVMTGDGTAFELYGLEGGDVIFGGPAINDINGGPGNDILFGGGDDDQILGDEGDDFLLGGTDNFVREQVLIGEEGNDTYITFAGETSDCLFIQDDAVGGQNVVNLVGFGPYSATVPFGQPNFGEGYIIEQDPIANGYVFIHVEDPESNGGVHTINGLLSPNVTIVDGGTASDFFDLNCTQGTVTGTGTPAPSGG